MTLTTTKTVGKNMVRETAKKGKQVEEKEGTGEICQSK